ncbi:molybdopterin biosynthesis protein, partial [Rhizobium johnstonii]
MSALAACGLTEVAVLSRVRVAVVSSGSELAEPGEPRVAGRIPDSNCVALAAAFVPAGARLVLRGRVSDDVDELRRLL